MKQILISIKPKWVAKILNGEKTLEIRKTAPKEWADYLNGKTDKNPEPMTVYIYCTKGGDYIGYVPKKYVGKVVAKFTLDVYAIYNEGSIDETDTMYTKYLAGRKVGHLWTEQIGEYTLLRDSYLLYRELNAYLKGKIGYAWHISDLEIFDKPKELSEFCTYRKPSYVLERAPQSWCYVEEALAKNYRPIISIDKDLYGDDNDWYRATFQEFPNMIGGIGLTEDAAIKAGYAMLEAEIKFRKEEGLNIPEPKEELS